MFRTIATRILGCAAMAVMLGAPAAHARPLSVEVWTDRGDDAVYKPGEAMQVKVRTNDDAFLLVYEIDAEGKVTVLYPWRRGTGQVEGKRTYMVPPENSQYELAVESTTGEGFVVAIASAQPFRDLPAYLRPFDPQGESVGYEDRQDSDEGFDEQGRVVGDPMVAMERIRRRVLGRPADTEGFATSYSQYYVGHEVRYPRYVCYDCHRDNRWAWWDGFDPYYTQCSVFDFRVNWNWAWGPTCWNGYVPYYYYVVRSDCPPNYRHWYNDHSRWSSWDGSQRWANLFGGPLVRHKSAPPQGYNPPSPRGEWKPGGGITTPPGYLPGSVKGDGQRVGLPIGHNTRVDGGDIDPRSRGQWRVPGGGTAPNPSPRWQPRMPVQREPVQRAPGTEDQGPVWRSPREERPSARPQPPRYEPPNNETPRSERPRETPAREPAHRDPPRAEPPRNKDNSPPPARPSQGRGGGEKQRGDGH